MTYSIIQPPFTLKFREMSRTELTAYNRWFMNMLPERVAGLEAEVRQSSSHADWMADSSPESLDGLGSWFVGQVETRARTREEIEAVKSKLTFPIDVPGEQLTNRTFSLAMDIGMYFARVVLKNLEGTQWDQPLRSKRFADYGQPVILGFGSAKHEVPLNPVRIMVSLAYGIARKNHEGPLLREVYDRWAEMRRP
jgi:hypothetical protein